MVRLYQIPDHPVIQNLERTGYPDGKEPEYPVCPICLTTEIEIVYRDRDDSIIGCNYCIKSTAADKLPSTSEYQECPECSNPCDTLYFDKNNIVGCDNCITSNDPWEESECFPPK